MVLVRGIITVTDLSLTVRSLINVQRFGTLNTKQSVPISLLRYIQNGKSTLNKVKYDPQNEYLSLFFSNSQSNEHWISPEQKFN